ncbi:hypothetical protein N7465_005196 [Penicillium sp. CMV-2018d]|nr:hypothetical protein N7465_005196 [Penicillium sp. CMV-2018d]
MQYSNISTFKETAMGILSTTSKAIQRFFATPLRLVFIPYDAELIRLWKENKGDPLLVQCVLNLEVLGVTRRIRRYVLKDAKEAWRLKESYRDTLAMEAVAVIGNHRPDSHYRARPFQLRYRIWPATACAYSSLICGILSTFFAFIVQQLLSNLHSPEDVRVWLTTTRHSYPHWLYWIFFGIERATNIEERVPSIASAIILTMPSKLLRLSILALFVALGIYLGCVYKAGLGNLEGRNANMWVFIFFMAVLTVMLCDAFMPMSVNSTGERRLSDEELPSSNSASSIAPIAGDTSSQACGTEDLIRDALESSIRAQEKSINAQKALLDLLNAQPFPISLTAPTPLLRTCPSPIDGCPTGYTEGPPRANQQITSSSPDS